MNEQTSERTKEQMNERMNGRPNDVRNVGEVTLADLLESRENRAAHQEELLKRYGGVLVSFTLNIPGPVKDGPSYRAALYEGIDLLNGAMGRLKRRPEWNGRVALVFEQKRFLPTGPEGYLCLCDEDGRTEELALAVKRETVAIEDGSPLGRLFDLDVLTGEGGIGRSRLELPPRKCLLCDEEAKVCTRGRRHSMEELLTEVHRILDEAGL